MELLTAPRKETLVGSDQVGSAGGAVKWTYLTYFDGSIKHPSDGLDKRGDIQGGVQDVHGKILWGASKDNLEPFTSTVAPYLLQDDSELSAR